MSGHVFVCVHVKETEIERRDRERERELLSSWARLRTIYLPPKVIPLLGFLPVLYREGDVLLLVEGGDKRKMSFTFGSIYFGSSSFY